MDTFDNRSQGSNSDPTPPTRFDANSRRSNWSEDLNIASDRVLSLGCAVDDADVGRIRRISHELDRQPSDYELLKLIRATQHHSRYSPQEQNTWQLVTSQLTCQAQHEARVVTVSRQQLGISSKEIPSLQNVNEKLQGTTGWEIVGVPGSISSDIFAQLLAHRILPVVIGIRVPDLETSDPNSLSFANMDVDTDLITGLWGAAPLLCIRPLANFLERWGAIGHALYLSDNEEIVASGIDTLATLFFFTVGHGLIEQGPSRSLRAYGAAFTCGDAVYEPSRCKVQPLSLEKIKETPTPFHLRTPPQLFATRQLRNVPALLDELRQELGL